MGVRLLFLAAGDPKRGPVRSVRRSEDGVPVTAIADVLSQRDKDKLLARLRELSEVDQLVREIPEQRPPEAPPTLSALSAAATTRRTA